MKEFIFGFLKICGGFFFFFLIHSVIIENDTEHLAGMIITCFLAFFIGVILSCDGARHFLK